VRRRRNRKKPNAYNSVELCAQHRIIDALAHAGTTPWPHLKKKQVRRCEIRVSYLTAFGDDPDLPARKKNVCVERREKDPHPKSVRLTSSSSHPAVRVVDPQFRGLLVEGVSQVQSLGQYMFLLVLACCTFEVELLTVSRTRRRRVGGAST
jgi:hypothetical protein